MIYYCPHCEFASSVIKLAWHLRDQHSYGLLESHEFAWSCDGEEPGDESGQDEEETKLLSFDDQAGPLPEIVQSPGISLGL